MVCLCAFLSCKHVKLFHSITNGIREIIPNHEISCLCKQRKPTQHENFRKLHWAKQLSYWRKQSYMHQCSKTTIYQHVLKVPFRLCLYQLVLSYFFSDFTNTTSLVTVMWICMEMHTIIKYQSFLSVTTVYLKVCHTGVKCKNQAHTFYTP